MVDSALGLLHTKPGTALGGRSRSRLLDEQNNKLRQQRHHENLNSIECLRDRSIVSQVDLSHTLSDVSSIPDYDLFNHTEKEVLRSKRRGENAREAQEQHDAGRARTKEAVAPVVASAQHTDDGQAEGFECDLFAGLNELQLERMLHDPEAPALAPVPLMRAASAAKKGKSAVSGSNEAGKAEKKKKSKKILPGGGKKKKKKQGGDKAPSPVADEWLVVREASRQLLHPESSKSRKEKEDAKESNKASRLSQVAPKIFTSDAANVYYNAMKRTGNRLEEDGCNASGKAAASNAKALNDKKTSGKKVLPGGKKSKKKQQEDKQATLDRLVNEALAVARTPEEVAQYLLAQEDCETGDKMALYAAIIAKLMERNWQSDEKKKGSINAPSRSNPPVTIQQSMSGLMSTASSITHDSEFFKMAQPPKKKAEEDAPRHVGMCFSEDPGDEFDAPDFDPPIAEYPSPGTCGTESIYSGYPTEPDDSVVSQSTGKFLPEKLKLGKIDGVGGDDGVVAGRKDSLDGSSSAASRNPSVEGESGATNSNEPRDAGTWTPSDWSSSTERPIVPAAGSETMREEEEGGGEEEETSVVEDSAKAPAAPQQQAAAADVDDGVPKKSAASNSTNRWNMKTLRGVRAMGPSLFKKKKAAAVESRPPAKEEDGLPRSTPSVDTKDVVVPLKRAMSPSLVAKKERTIPEDKEEDPAADCGDSEYSGDSTASLSAGSAAGSSFFVRTRPTSTREPKSLVPTTKPKKSALPPRIPSRSTAPVELRQRREAAALDYGMSVASDEGGDELMLQLTASGNVEITELADAVGEESTARRALSPAVTAVAAKVVAPDSSSTNGNVEVCITPTRVTRRISPLLVPRKEMKRREKDGDSKDGKDNKKGAEDNKRKGKLAAAKDKYQKHRPDPMTAATLRTPEGKAKEAKGSPVKTLERAPSISAIDDATISSSESRRSKRERLEKIKKYRKKTNAEASDGVSTKNGEKEEVKPEDSKGEQDAGAEKKKKDQAATLLRRNSTWKSTKSSSSFKSSTMVEEIKRRVAMLEERSGGKEKEQLRQMDPMVSPGTQAGDSASSSPDAKKSIASPGAKSTKTKGSKGSRSSMTKEKKTHEPWESGSELTNFLNKEGTNTEGTQKQGEKEPGHQQQVPKVWPTKILIGMSESSEGVTSHPVKHINFGPDDDGANDNGSHLDVSLPPEIKDGKKIKIWHSDASFMGSTEQEDKVHDHRADPSRRAERRILFTDKIFQCGTEPNTDASLTVGQDTVDDVNSIFGNTVGGHLQEQGQPPEHVRGDVPIDRAPFACGIMPEPARFKENIRTDVKGAVQDLRGGFRTSVRNLLGAFDITQDGGVDFLKENMTNANDHLHGRPPSHDMSRVRERFANPQPEKMTGETPPKVKNTPAQTRKKQAQKLYLQKLKKISLEHL